MVQVDVFWSYGIGAGFAVAASRQLLKAREEKNEAPFESRTFIKTLLFLSILFAPSGAYLLWAFPDWETMQVATTHRDLPGWLVALFGITNITQGILGYWVAYTLIMKKKTYQAYLHWVIAHLIFAFILVHGWDGTGYQRFFSSNKEKFLNWQTSNVADWFTSDVAISLGIFGMVMVPILFGWLGGWFKRGYALAADVDRERALRRSTGSVAAAASGACLLAPLVLAILVSLLIHGLGWIMGSVVGLLLIYVAGISRWGIFAWYYRKLMLLPTEAEPKLLLGAAGAKAGA